MNNNNENNNNNNNLNNMSEIEREKEEREKGRKAHHHRPIENISGEVFFYSFFVTIACIVFFLIGAWVVKMDVSTIIKSIFSTISMIGVIIGLISAPICFISLIIYGIASAINDKIASKYCPYCYKKDFKRTKLSEECIRVYNKQEKRKVGFGDNKREIYVPVRVEEWKGKFRNECCGKEYENTWEHKIDLRD